MGRRDITVRGFLLGHLRHRLTHTCLSRGGGAGTVSDYVFRLTHGLILNSTSQTADVLLSFILAMGLNPDVMRRGQAEVDAVVGRDRMPNFGDMEHLPYVSAIVKEALRWKMIAPVGQS